MSSLRADWTMIALRDGELPSLDMRFLALGPDAQVFEAVRELPPWLGRELASPARWAPSERAGGLP